MANATDTATAATYVDNLEGLDLCKQHPAVEYHMEKFDHPLGPVARGDIGLGRGILLREGHISSYAAHLRPRRGLPR